MANKAIFLPGSGVLSKFGNALDNTIARSRKDGTLILSGGISMKSACHSIAAGVAFSLLAASVHAAPVTLDFDQISGDAGEVRDFYNGGKSETGSGPGPNLGMTFVGIPPKPFSSAFVQCVDNNICAQPNHVLRIFGEFNVPNESEGVLIHVAGGFRGTVEFDARMRPENGGQFAEVFTTNEPTIVNRQRIETPDVDRNPSCNANINACAFAHFIINVAGGFSPPDIIAHDLVFATFGTGAVDIDNIHFSDLILPADAPPDGVPEPASWVLMASGLGLFGVTWRRRRGSAAAAGTSP